MTPQEAVHVLRKHNGQVDDGSDGLLKSLRPYVGINESHFCEIVKAIYFAAPLLNSNCVDRDLVHTIWDLTRTARSWTSLDHDRMLPRSHFISQGDKKTLDRWIFEIETITLYLLRGFEDWESLAGLSDEVNLYNSMPDSQWLVVPFTRQLEFHLEGENQGGSGNDEESLCEALIKIGADALPAIPMLQTVVQRTEYPEVRVVAEKAISSILRKHSEV